MTLHSTANRQGARELEFAFDFKYTQPREAC
jgi:hypothetical protein